MSSISVKAHRAFTLMELMVVVGIMAFLGLASANGYNALRRGMADRAAVDAVSSLLLAAKERAIVDRVPTAVFCWNRCVRAATVDDNAVVVGEAVAIRRAGRITHTSGNLLFDEYGDLNVAYDIEEDQGRLPQRKGFRLWQMDDHSMSSMKYSIVSDGVAEEDVPGFSFLPLSEGDASVSSNINIRACAFYNKGMDRGSPTWNVGTGYGMEFQKLRLPDGFVFSGQVPTTVGDIKEAPQSFYFDPEKIDSAYGSAGSSVEISFCRPGDDGNPVHDHAAGTASAERRAAH